MIRFIIYIRELIALKLAILFLNLSELSNVTKDEEYTIGEYNKAWVEEYLKNFKECLRKDDINGESKN